MLVLFVSLELFWGYFDPTLALFWGCSLSLGLFWGYFRTTLGSFWSYLFLWGCFGAILGLLWSYFGASCFFCVILGYFGASLELFWSYVGAMLGLCWGCVLLCRWYMWLSVCVCACSASMIPYEIAGGAHRTHNKHFPPCPTETLIARVWARRQHKRRLRDQPPSRSG